MKVILDTNIYISYLLTHNRSHVIGRVVEACIAYRTIELLVPVELLDELISKVTEKPYLQAHIHSEELARLLTSLEQSTEMPAPLASFAPLSRDPDDDYLLAYGLSEDADFLVTGDDDLLSLEQVNHLEILSAAQFWERLSTDFP